MSNAGDQQTTPEKPPSRRVRKKAVVVGVGAGLLLVVVGGLLVAWSGARDRASREKEMLEEQRRRTEARLAELTAEAERLRTQAEKLKRRKRGGEWLCDRLPCNQGDLMPLPRPPPPGEPRRRPYGDPLDPRTWRKQR